LRILVGIHSAWGIGIATFFLSLGIGLMVEVGGGGRLRPFVFQYERRFLRAIYFKESKKHGQEKPDRD
jgi:hypothetical protein